MISGTSDAAPRPDRVPRRRRPARPRPRRGRCRAPAAGRTARHRRAGSSSRRRRRRRAPCRTRVPASGTSSASTKLGTPSSVTRSQRPSRHVAIVRTRPAAVSSTTSVSAGDRHRARLDQRRDDADGVRAAHRVRTVGLQDHEAGVRRRVARLEHEVGARLRPPARLEAQEPTQRVVDLVDVVELVAHRRARDLEHPAEEARALLALGVDLDAGERPRDPHQAGVSETASAWSSIASNSAAASSSSGSSGWRTEPVAMPWCSRPSLAFWL